MKTKKYVVRTMARKDLDTAIKWAANEGWNPGLYDADCFYSTDPKGFFIGLLDDKPISCISAVSYNRHFGFIGFYIVRQEYRNKGYGIQVWKKAMQRLKTHNIGLDGVVSQQENYRKSGFKLAYRNIRFQCISKKSHDKFQDIKAMANIPFKQLAAYDSTLFPALRPQFLRKWISQPQSFAIGALQNNKLIGYSVIRKCKKGYKIGPLFANNEMVADKLFKVMCNSVRQDTEIFLDIPEINYGAMKLAERYKMRHVFETVRMYTKEKPKIPINKIFGITSFELG